MALGNNTKYILGEPPEHKSIPLHAETIQKVMWQPNPIVQNEAGRKQNYAAFYKNKNSHSVALLLLLSWTDGRHERKSMQPQNNP